MSNQHKQLDQQSLENLAKSIGANKIVVIACSSSIPDCQMSYSAFNINFVDFLGMASWIQNMAREFMAQTSNTFQKLESTNKTNAN